MKRISEPSDGEDSFHNLQPPRKISSRIQDEPYMTLLGKSSTVSYPVENEHNVGIKKNSASKFEEDEGYLGIKADYTPEVSSSYHKKAWDKRPFKSGAPLWLVLNEAALFWRASGNATSALSCLRRALNSAPQEHLDIPLVNVANLLLHYRLYQEASQVLERALAINRSEPLTLLSLGNVCLAQGNVSGAVSVFRQALSLGTRCPECESSLRLIRCLQFYPFLYNLSSSPACKQDTRKLKDWFLENAGLEAQSLPMVVRALWMMDSERWEAYQGEHTPNTLEEGVELVLSYLEAAITTTAAQPEDTAGAMLVLDGNGSGEELQRDEEVQRVEESEEEEDKKEEEWQLKEDLIGAFEGALGVKGRRVDLQRIRVLKRGGGGEADAGGRAGPCFGNCEDDDGAEWITFQVKRMRKPKTDPSDLQVGSRKREAGFHSALEISGPQIPSPGPPGRRRDYLSLGWPSPDECQRLRRVEPTTVASTWLAVSAKSIDFTGKSTGAQPDYRGRWCANQTSWVLSSMAALYWRVKGQGKKAVDCLRQALNHAPHHMKLWDDAITVASMAVEIAPHFVVNHFTLANVFIAMEKKKAEDECLLSPSPPAEGECLLGPRPPAEDECLLVSLPPPALTPAREGDKPQSPARKAEPHQSPAREAEQDQSPAKGGDYTLLPPSSPGDHMLLPPPLLPPQEPEGEELQAPPPENFWGGEGQDAGVPQQPLFMLLKAARRAPAQPPQRREPAPPGAEELELPLPPVPPPQGGRWPEPQKGELPATKKGEEVWRPLSPAAVSLQEFLWPEPHKGELPAMKKGEVGGPPAPAAFSLQELLWPEPHKGELPATKKGEVGAPPAPAAISLQEWTSMLSAVPLPAGVLTAWPAMGPVKPPLPARDFVLDCWVFKGGGGH
ncbi:UNVERIFIED_CONTAM: hypothetical protein FKN15_001676 [Acipenser sinensis]